MIDGLRRILYTLEVELGENDYDILRAESRLESLKIKRERIEHSIAEITAEIGKVGDAE